MRTRRALRVWKTLAGVTTLALVGVIVWAVTSHHTPTDVPAGLRDSIKEKKTITPADWQAEYGVYDGATFNLAHTIGQVLFFRPHNRFREIKNCYLVDGGTHPGSGLPTICESGRISSNLLCKDLGIPFKPPAVFDPAPRQPGTSRPRHG